MSLSEKPNFMELAHGMVWAALMVSFVGCHAARPPKDAFGPKPAPEVRLSPGDVIDIKFFYVPELNETEPVRPDGKISLQLIGEAEVEGRTPAEVRDELTRRYSEYLGEKADVAVIVRSLWNRRVYVGGEVNTPRAVQMPGQLTALEAIMGADGFNMATAKVGNVVILRHKDGQRYGLLLDLGDALSGKGAQPFYLEPRDIVYVPQTRIANVNRWIDQHINLLLPVGLVYTRPVGEGTIGISPTTR